MNAETENEPSLNKVWPPSLFGENVCGKVLKQRPETPLRHTASMVLVKKSAILMNSPIQNFSRRCSHEKIHIENTACSYIILSWTFQQIRFKIGTFYTVLLSHIKHLIRPVFKSKASLVYPLLRTISQLKRILKKPSD